MPRYNVPVRGIRARLLVAKALAKATIFTKDFTFYTDKEIEGVEPAPLPVYKVDQRVQVTQTWTGKVIGAWQEGDDNHWVLQVKYPGSHHWEVLRPPVDGSTVTIIKEAVAS